MKPITNYEDPLRGAIHELVSAMSALNMEPDPLPQTMWPDKGGVPVFLSECDKWAAHSMDHMHAAVDQLTKAERQRESFRDLLLRFECWGHEALNGNPDLNALERLVERTKQLLK